MGTEVQPAALVIAPEVPYPLAGGGALRTASLLHYLTQRYAVDLIVFRQPGAGHPAAALPAGLVRSVTVIDLPPNRRDRAARAWRNAARVAREVPPLIDRFSGFDRHVAKAVEGRRYDVGLIEHFWCAPYVEAIADCCRRTVMDLHNVESVLHARCAATEGAASAFAHNVFHRACVEMERAWLPRFYSVLTASEADAETIRGIAPSACISVYPNAIPQPSVWRIPAAGSSNVVAFSGNMEYHPNISAVRFFRAEVWPRLRAERPDLVWRLVGKNPDAIRSLVTGDPRIEVVGPVEDAVGELASAGVAVVPLLAGSGTRFKILEAWAAGVPVVSTRIGAEGLPVCDEREVLLADGGIAFAAAVSRLLACRDLRERLATAGRLLLQKEFTWVAAWRSLDF